MASRRKASRDRSTKNEEHDKKDRVRKDSKGPSGQSVEIKTGPISLEETPFNPRTDEHAAMLSGTTAPEQRHELMAGLQRSYGNRYVQRLVKSIDVQAKLTVSSPGDMYEQEADRVAKAVTNSANTPVQRQAPDEEEELQAQRQLAEEEEEEIQTKPLLQRQAEIEEEEVQTKSTGSQPATVSEALENRIKAAQGSGHHLSDNVRKPMERVFKADFSEVRVHTDPEANMLSQQLSARAFTAGQDVFFREGEYSPGSSDGQELIGHELTHVVQQGAAGIKKSNEEVQTKLSKPDRIRQMGEGHQASIQRYVAVAKNAMTNDFVELTSIDYALKEAKGPVELLANADFSGMKKEEVLFLVGHGWVGSSGNYDASTIVNYLLNTPQSLKNPIQAIRFTSCYAGAGFAVDPNTGLPVQGPRGSKIQDTAQDYNNSVVAQINQALLAKHATEPAKGWNDVKVSGARGPSIKSAQLPSKEFTVVDPSKSKTVSLLQAVVEAVYDPRGRTQKVLSDVDKLIQAQDDLASVDPNTKPFTPQQRIEMQASEVSKETGGFFREFVKYLNDPPQFERDFIELARTEPNLLVVTNRASNKQEKLSDVMAKPEFQNLSTKILTLRQPMLELPLPPPSPVKVKPPAPVKVERKKKLWPCFITTACVEARGLPDDCYELETLRAFRDGYMRRLSNGPALISHYYEIAPRIVARIKERPNAQEIFSGLYDQIVKAVRLIEAGKNRQAVQRYSAMVLKLEQEYL